MQPRDLATGARPRRDDGLPFNLGIEIEFYLVKASERAGIEPANSLDVMEKAAYDIVDLLGAYPVLDEIVTYMNKLGWDVHSFDHEDSNSQFELDFAYADAMTSADRQVLWRMMMKEVARKHGCDVTVMPKPYSNRTGTGGHFNMTLADLDTGENLFADDADPRGCWLCVARVPLHRRGAGTCTCAHRGRLSHGQLLQAAREVGLDDGVHVGACVHHLRPQQPDAHGSHTVEGATRREPGGGRLL